MAKDTSKKKALSKAKMAATKSTINAVANNARKSGKKKKKKKSSPDPKSVAKAYSAYKGKNSKKSSSKHSKPKTSRAKLAKGEEAKSGKHSSKSKKANQNKQEKKGKGKHSKLVKTKAGRKVVGIVAAALVALVGIGCLAFTLDEQPRLQYVPQATILDGQLDISGLTQDELRQVLDQRVNDRTGTIITVNAPDAAHEIGMEEVGAINVDATIDAAFSPYRENPFLRAMARVGELITGESPTRYVSLVCDVNQEALHARAEQLRDAVNREAKNATYAYDRNSHALVVADAKQGIEVDAQATAARIEEALLDTTSSNPERLHVDVEAAITEPTSHEPGQGIFVDIRNCRVVLYEGGVPVISYACTPGTSGYATPTGDFYLSYKDGAPTWYNPHSAWSEGMPETIGPGPSNPLGVRALAVSCGNGIFLHGTTNTGGLGSPGSHGCVRLSNNNIIDLYNRVSEGIPIIIR